MSGIFSPHNKMARPFGMLNQRAYNSGSLGDEQTTADINDPSDALPATVSNAINPADYPWMTFSVATQSAQVDMNASLQASGYCPIATDGILGPATCGAANYLSLPMPTCSGQASTPPSSSDNGCAAPAAPKPAPAAPRPAVPGQPATPSSLVTPGGAPAKPASASMLMTGGLILGVVGVGYYFAKKKGMI
jgi:hypothetical protein